MPFRSLLRSVRVMIAGLAALVVTSLFTPGTAEAAGCSHPYYKLLAGEAERLDPLGLSDFKSADGAAPVLPTVPRPCTGAFCSGLPATPPTVPPLTLAKTAPDRWISPGGATITPELGSTWIAVVDDGASPSHLGSSLFRPPRAA